jgi:hypothetical protein
MDWLCFQSFLCLDYINFTQASSRAALRPELRISEKSGSLGLICSCFCALKFRATVTIINALHFLSQRTQRSRRYLGMWKIACLVELSTYRKSKHPQYPFRAFRGKEVIHQLPSFTLRSYAALREIFLLCISQNFKELGGTPSLKSFVYPYAACNTQTLLYLTQRRKGRREIWVMWEFLCSVRDFFLPWRTWRAWRVGLQ